MVAMATKSVTVVTELLDCFPKQSLTVSRVKTAAPKKRAGCLIADTYEKCDTDRGVTDGGTNEVKTNYVKCDLIAGDLRELSSLSLRYRLTNGHFDDVHLQLIIEINYYCIMFHNAVSPCHRIP
eukprot:sb/3475739/